MVDWVRDGPPSTSHSKRSSTPLLQFPPPPTIVPRRGLCLADGGHWFDGHAEQDVRAVGDAAQGAACARCIVIGADGGMSIVICNHNETRSYIQHHEPATIDSGEQATVYQPALLVAVRNNTGAAAIEVADDDAATAPAPPAATKASLCWLPRRRVPAAGTGREREVRNTCISVDVRVRDSDTGYEEGGDGCAAVLPTSEAAAYLERLGGGQAHHGVGKGGLQLVEARLACR